LHAKVKKKKRKKKKLIVFFSIEDVPHKECLPAG